MQRARVLGWVLLLVLGAFFLRWQRVRPTQPAASSATTASAVPTAASTPARPPAPSALAAPDPPPPAPHPPADLPPATPLRLEMPDGVPLLARWYAAAIADRSVKSPTPVLVLDAGTRRPRADWQSVVRALLAQRPVHVLWLDDAQPAHADARVRAGRAAARWRAALDWLAPRVPDARVALVGAADAGAAVWTVAGDPRPLSLASLWPEPLPQQLDPAALPRLALVVLPEPPTPSWATGLHNARVQFASVPAPPQRPSGMPSLPTPLAPDLAADLAGWLFAALGPR